jgi:hypothetical protein
MNRAITSDRKTQDHLFPLRKANYALLAVALVAAGYEATRYASLEPSCFPDQLTETEYRKASWVQFYINALALSADLETLPDINVCELVSADDTALALGTKASLTTALAGANNDLVHTARQYGSAGNILQVQYVDPAANSQALAVTVVGSLIRVSLATNGGGAITSTASLVMAAINAHVTAKTLIVSTLAASNTGAGVVVASAAVNLTGGTDA